MQRKEFERNIKPQDASKLRIGVVASRFNEDVSGSMLEGVLGTLKLWNVKGKNTFVVRVYGSFEIPFAAQRLIKKKRLYALIAIGCIIKGETRHDEYLAHATAQGLMRVSLDSDVPIGFGIITTNTLEQA